MTPPAIRRKQILSATLLFALGLAAPAAEAATAPAEITVDPARVTGSVCPLFFGVNTLFWIDDDPSRADGKITKLLKDMKCGLMRYPGGEVGDNFHWKTTRLDDPAEFPHADGPDKLSFDEFVAWKQEVGAEGILVVNLETAFVRTNLDAAVAEAVEWVTYANKIKRYNIKYWEIGNESYLYGTRYPLSAEEYARAVVKFSKAMKAVDPTIQIGCQGIHDLRAPGFIDKLSPAAVAELRKMKRSAIRADGLSLTQDGPRTPWWPTVVRIARGHFDFVIIHRYDQSRLSFQPERQPPLQLKEMIAAIDTFFRKECGRHIPIALTEWNVSKKANFSEIEYSLTLAEEIGNYLEGGVELATFWPMRFASKTSAFRQLLDNRTNAPRPAYQVLSLFSRHIGETLVGHTASSSEVYVVASRRSADGAVVVFVVNRSFGAQGAAALLSVPGALAATAESLVASDDKAAVRTVPTAMQAEAGKWRCVLPPGSITLLTFKTQ